jgi:diphosphomevalonate decarboxylase
LTQSVSYRCPSNIALIKYWGKKEGGIQLPANPSISLNLSDLFAETRVTLAHGNVSGKPAFSFLLDGRPAPSFEPKLRSFLQRLWHDMPLVRDFHLHIESKNNFPHGTGIASSAAGFGALALCICDLQQQTSGVAYPDFAQIASTVARLGSGSACRSIYGGLAAWGVSASVPNSSDTYAVQVPIPVEKPLDQMMDAVLIVDAAEKKVSSSEGHSLLSSNPYAPVRFETANANMGRILEALKKGNTRSFISIVESEAMQLHAMMMVSSPYYLLMRPNTVAIIEKIWEFRETSSLPVMFTLDAGANVHLLFPGMYRREVVNFIEQSLLSYCQNRLYFCSATGKGPEKLS